MNQDKDTLEKMIDTHGLPSVLEMLGDICHEKAEHIRTNWQDAALANTWRARGADMYRTSGHKNMRG